MQLTMMCGIDNGNKRYRLWDSKRQYFHVKLVKSCTIIMWRDYDVALLGKKKSKEL